MTKHNKYCYIYQDYTKLAIEKSVTLRKITNKNHALYSPNIAEYIDVNPLFKEGHGGWKHGQIIPIDPDCAEVKVLYFLNNENHSFWIHLAAKCNTKYDILNDVYPLKQFTFIDVIDNNYYNKVNNKQPQQQLKQKDAIIIIQSINFGDDRKQIMNAITIARNKTDINEIIECIERQEQQQLQQQQNMNYNMNNDVNNVNMDNEFNFYKIQTSEISDINNMNLNMSEDTDNNKIEIDSHMIIDDHKNDAKNNSSGVIKGLKGQTYECITKF